jgi:hypothetical protein
MCFSKKTLCSSKGLFKVGDNVINVFGSDTDTNEVLGYTRCNLLVVRELLVGGCPWIYTSQFDSNDSNYLRIAKVLLSPTFAKLEMSLNPSTILLPASPPPLIPKDKTPPNPLGRYFFACSCAK